MFRFYEYDDVGRLTYEWVCGDICQEFSHEYDSLDRRTSVTDPAGIETAYQYNTLGQRIRVTENANTNGSRVTDSVYDRLGRLAKLVAYDGQAPASPDPEHAYAQTTTYQYDLAGRRAGIVYPDSAGPNDVVTFAYDLAGRMTCKVDQREIATDYAYDGRGLLTGKSVTGSGIDDATAYTYDGLGRMTLAQRGSIANPDAVSKVEFAYNDLSQLTSETQTLFEGSSRQVGYEHAPSGNRTTLDYPVSQISLDYAYDDLYRVTRIDRDGETLAEYEYDGLLLSGRFVKTTSAAERWIEHRLIHDGDRRIAHRVNRSTTNGEEILLAGYRYEYDMVGNRTFAGGSGNAAAAENVTYSYDSLHRLVSADYETADGSESFNYDLLGNRQGLSGYSDSRSGGADVAYGPNNKANEYMTIGGQEVLYDAAGNLIRDEDGLGYGYDVENRLTRVFQDTNANGVYNEGVDTLLVEYAYDALARRIEKADYTVAESPPLTTRYVYDGQNVIEEINTNGTLERYYINGPTYIDERILIHDADTAKDYYYLLKELYTVAGLVDEDGQLLEAYTYNAYGKVHIFTSGAVSFDSNADGDTDLADFADFQACFSGDGTPSTCAAEIVAVLDSDNDADLDLTDLSAMLNCLSGPWLSLPADGDFNSNGVVDEGDDEAFTEICYSGQGGGINTNGCQVFDFDADGDVDIYDYGVLAGLMGQPVGQPTNACLSPTNASTVGNSYFFTGRRLDFIAHDEQSEPKQLYHYRARSYDPNNGRFNLRDPAGYIDGMNLYQYVRSNPARANDPAGLCSAYDDAPLSEWVPGWSNSYQIRNIGGFSVFWYHYITRSTPRQLFYPAGSHFSKWLAGTDTVKAMLESGQKHLKNLVSGEGRGLRCNPKTNTGSKVKCFQGSDSRTTFWEGPFDFGAIGGLHLEWRARCIINKKCCYKGKTNCNHITATCRTQRIMWDNFRFGFPGKPFNWYADLGRVGTLASLILDFTDGAGCPSKKKVPDM